MKKGEHTPGPWIARPYNVVSGRVAEWSIDSKDWKDLAHVYVQDDDTDDVCELGDGNANARLIAASPKMLKALLTVLEWSGPLSGAIRAMVEDAVKEARGEK